MPSGFMGNSSIPPYAKYTALGLLVVTYVSTLAYAGGYSIAHGWSLDGMPAVVFFIIGSGLTIALSTFNIHVGVSTAESGAITGAVGPTGATGPAGATGATGPAGPAGATVSIPGGGVSSGGVSNGTPA